MINKNCVFGNYSQKGVFTKKNAKKKEKKKKKKKKDEIKKLWFHT